MKIKRLIPALAMLLVSAVLLGTSTFAWFSMNQTVHATNMQIRASVPTQLLIKGSASGAEYKSAISFTASADSAKSVSNAALEEVPPVSYKLQTTTGTYALITEAENWLKLTPAASPYVSDTGRMIGLANGASYDTWEERVTDSKLTTPVYYAVATPNSTSTATGDFIQDTFTLKLNGNLDGQTDTVAVTINAHTTATNFIDAAGTDSDVLLTDIFKAVHIAFTWGTDGYKEFDMGSATPVYQTTNAGAATITLGGASEWLNTFTANAQEVVYTLYIWYDGEDLDCMNRNASRIDQFVYDFTFTLGAGA